jgi:hypothetical protein
VIVRLCDTAALIKPPRTDVSEDCACSENVQVDQTNRVSDRDGAHIMGISAHSGRVSNVRRKWSRPPIIHTTLYDLLSAIDAEVGADEADLALAVVAHLLATHRITYTSTYKPGQWSTRSRPISPRRRKAASTVPSYRITRRADRLGLEHGKR